ncbi:gamma-2-syntrophin isoform X2 [Dunckerocampus dactyliophorus]|uniref:gamma-2-syntrophin isoform X2 n=1 Tax=Dunckerocampus dactyliophorus TaxID=161453 RepID=UPI0024057799|nr:gamma-2-syntrophin isoform X2 [Dunckerocampus dactyliophorus]
MNVTGKQHPQFIERPASLFPPTSLKSGIALLYNEETTNSYDVCLKLTNEVLTIQKLDVVCTGGSESQVNYRTVVLRRQETGCLGLSIKGGAEHNVPVVISKIFKAQVVDQVGKLFVGDAVLQVNGINVEHCTHEQVVHLLRTAGDEVIITVRYLREVPSFLKLPLGSSSADNSGESSSLFDCGSHFNGSKRGTASSPPSPSANEPKYEKRWMDAVSLPLLMARVSRYKAGMDKLRSNTFEVLALNGSTTNILQFCNAAETTDWLQAISTKISDLTLENMKLVNKYSASDDQIVHMGWACESSDRRGASRRQSFKFLAMRGPYFHIFSSPPLSAADWGQAEISYNLCEVLFKVHKLWLTEDCWLQARLYLGLEHPPDQQDTESLCFSILISHGQSHTFRVELSSDLAVWEKSFQRAVFLEVQRMRTKSYMCSNHGTTLCFTIDFDSGFTCSDRSSNIQLWRYKFSQLKGSSDDGKTRVKLLFKNAESKQIDMKELEFVNLTAVLHCIHAFIAAKVASVDPLFMCAHSLCGS